MGLQEFDFSEGHFQRIVDNHGPMAFEDPAEAQWLANKESPEFQAYTKELYRRLPIHVTRAAVTAGEVGSNEWMREQGAWLWRNRRALKLSRYDVAERGGIDVHGIRFLETGSGIESELNPSFLRSYVNGIGNPELYAEALQRFGIQE